MQMYLATEAVSGKKRLFDSADDLSCFFLKAPPICLVETLDVERPSLQEPSDAR